MKYEATSKVELKESLIDDVKKEIVAFLNTDGGIIYIGVKDNGEVAHFNNYKDRDNLDIKISN